jgi:hypothetical protein
MEDGGLGRSVLSDADLPQDDLQGTKAGEGRLQEIEPDKGGEPEPVGAVKMSQQKAEEDERAGKPTDERFHMPIWVWPFFLKFN